MPRLIDTPTRVVAAGDPPKTIEEFVGRASDGQGALSVAHMKSPQGWSEPGQRPEFDEYTVVVRGELVIQHEGGSLNVRVGQATSGGDAPLRIYRARPTVGR